MATSRRDVNWPTCAEADCIGVVHAMSGKCWAHADQPDLDAALEQLGANAEPCPTDALAWIHRTDLGGAW